MEAGKERAEVQLELGQHRSASQNGGGGEIPRRLARTPDGNAFALGIMRECRFPTIGFWITAPSMNSLYGLA